MHSHPIPAAIDPGPAFRVPLIRSYDRSCDDLVFRGLVGDHGAGIQSFMAALAKITGLRMVTVLLEHTTRCEDSHDD